jgi:hypothetical protein
MLEIETFKIAISDTTWRVNLLGKDGTAAPNQVMEARHREWQDGSKPHLKA